MTGYDCIEEVVSSAASLLPATLALGSEEKTGKSFNYQFAMILSYTLSYDLYTCMVSFKALMEKPLSISVAHQRCDL